jgi:hypothetical protein
VAKIAVTLIFVEAESLFTNDASSTSITPFPINVLICNDPVLQDDQSCWFNFSNCMALF